ncbi:MAG: hypothetical protein H6910_05720 [Rickettsiaceae bacterium]|nr:hypothetical protein [Rickettsiaceae bacterium]
MKTILPERSLVIKPLLDQVTFKILTVRKDTMLYALYRFGYHSKVTVHGFIATALTIVNERDFKYDVIERQLAHVELNKIRASYNHTKYLEEKREMMQYI